MRIARARHFALLAAAVSLHTACAGPNFADTTDPCAPEGRWLDDGGCLWTCDPECPQGETCYKGACYTPEPTCPPGFAPKGGKCVDFCEPPCGPKETCLAGKCLPIVPPDAGVHFDAATPTPADAGPAAPPPVPQ